MAAETFIMNHRVAVINEDQSAMKGDKQFLMLEKK